MPPSSIGTHPQQVDRGDGAMVLSPGDGICSDITPGPGSTRLMAHGVGEVKEQVWGTVPMLPPIQASLRMNSMTKTTPSSSVIQLQIQNTPPTLRSGKVRVPRTKTRMERTSQGASSSAKAKAFRCRVECIYKRYDYGSTLVLVYQRLTLDMSAANLVVWAF